MNKFDFRKYIKIAEAQEQVYRVELPVPLDGLSPIITKDNLDYHYNILHKNYVKKAQSGGGSFQEAGAFLHNVFFEQLQEPKGTNNPTDAAKLLINDNFGSYSTFKKEFLDAAMSIQGSGWCYLTTKGAIKTIKNHDIVSDIAILVDMWEHSYYMDYGPFKDAYLKNVWKIIDWRIVNARIGL